MRTIIVTEFVTADGIAEAPGGGDHPHAGWTFREVTLDEAAYDIKSREQAVAGALLLGRVTYGEFAPVWPTMDDFARYNDLDKYVVSTTLAQTDPGWGPATILRGLDEVARLVGHAAYSNGVTLSVLDVVRDDPAPG